MATATMTKPAVTPNVIKTAEQEARRLCILAFTPQPIRQPDGTTIALCWNGRVARAYERLAEARIEAYRMQPKPNTKTPKVAAIEGKIAELEHEARQAVDAATAAASDWAAKCTAAGVPCEPLSIYPAECTCDGCKAQQQAQARRNAHAAYAEATFALMAPSAFDTPPFVELMRKAQDENARDALWRHFKTMLDAAEQYIKACDADGVQPDWRGVLCPWSELP